MPLTQQVMQGFDIPNNEISFTVITSKVFSYVMSIPKTPFFTQLLSILMP